MSQASAPPALPVRTDHGSGAALVAVGALFAMNGVVIGGYAGVLPALRTRLGVDAGTIAVLLFSVGVAAVLAMQVAGRLADRVGARRVVLTAMPLMAAGAVVLGLAPSMPVAVVGGCWSASATAPRTSP